MDKQNIHKYDVEEARHGGIGTATTKGELGEVDEDLPITANRSAKWWYIAVHNITAMVGAGVLGLPYAMALLGELTAAQSWFCSNEFETPPLQWFATFHSVATYCRAP